jgi:hypothetical protein
MSGTWRYRVDTFGVTKVCDGEHIKFANDKTRQFWKRLHFKKCKLCEESNREERRGINIQFTEEFTQNALH